MTQTDAILAQRFGNDRMLYTARVEKTLLGQVGDTAEPTRFLVRRAADLDGTRKIRAKIAKCLRRHDGRRQPALHVAGAPSVKPAAAQHAAERVHAPAMAGLDHVGMAVEMHADTREDEPLPKKVAPSQPAESQPVPARRRAAGERAPLGLKREVAAHA